jgi:hypothetical protein
MRADESRAFPTEFFSSIIPSGKPLTKRTTSGRRLLSASITVDHELVEAPVLLGERRLFGCEDFAQSTAAGRGANCGVQAFDGSDEAVSKRDISIGLALGPRGVRPTLNIRGDCVAEIAQLSEHELFDIDFGKIGHRAILRSR